VGRRSRRRDRDAPDAPSAPDAEYTDAEGNVLVLRGSLSARSRREYTRVLAGEGRVSGAEAAREDAWQRAIEFLFEHLAARWTIAGLPLERQDQLLGRYRMANAAERAWVRDVLREHVTAHFPELQAP
jgi:hypothetical protein